MKPALLILFFLTAMHSMAQTGLVWVRDGILWGALDTNGKVLLSPQFDTWKPVFKKNVCYIVSRAGKYGLVNGSGKIVAPLKYDGIQTQNPDCDVAVTAISRDSAKLWRSFNDAGWYGAVNPSGEIIPPVYLNMVIANENLFVVSTKTAFTSFNYNDPPFQGVVNARNEWLVPEQKYAIGGSWFFRTLSEPRSFWYLPAWLLVKNGTVLSAKEHHFIWQSNEIMLVEKGGLWGALSHTGEWIIPLSHTVIKDVKPSGLHLVNEGGRPQRTQLLPLGGIWKVTDAAGNILFQKETEDMALLTDSLVAWKQNGDWGITDFRGRIIKDFDLVRDSLCFNHAAFYRKGTVQGRIYFENKGRFVEDINMRPRDTWFVWAKEGWEYESGAYRYHFYSGTISDSLPRDYIKFGYNRDTVFGCAILYQNGLPYGERLVIFRNGKYKVVQDAIKESHAIRVKAEDKWSMFTLDGEELIPPVYDSLITSGDSFFFGLQENRWMICHLSNASAGTRLPETTGCKPFSEDLAPVATGGKQNILGLHGEKWGYMHPTGEIAIPCQWEDALPFYHGIAAVRCADITRRNVKGSAWMLIRRDGKPVDKKFWDEIVNMP